VKVLAGNPGKRPLNVAEPKPELSKGRAPRGLGQEGSKFWRKYAPALAALGILTEVDEPGLRMAAEHYEVAVRAATQLHDEDLTLEGRDGPRKNPLVQIMRDNSSALKGWLIEFGMTPAARSKVKREEEQMSLADELFARVAEMSREPDDDDPLAEFEDDGEAA